MDQNLQYIFKMFKQFKLFCKRICNKAECKLLKPTLKMILIPKYGCKKHFEPRNAYSEFKPTPYQD